MIWLLDLALGAIPNLWPWLIAAAGTVVVGVGAYFSGRSEGAARAKQKNAEAALDATVKGQEAARNGRAEAATDLAKGKTPQQIKEANDGKW